MSVLITYQLINRALLVGLINTIGASTRWYPLGMKSPTAHGWLIVVMDM